MIEQLKRQLIGAWWVIYYHKPVIDYFWWSVACDASSDTHCFNDSACSFDHRLGIITAGAWLAGGRRPSQGISRGGRCAAYSAWRGDACQPSGQCGNTQLCAWLGSDATQPHRPYTEPHLPCQEPYASALANVWRDRCDRELRPLALPSGQRSAIRPKSLVAMHWLMASFSLPMLSSCAAPCAVVCMGIAQPTNQSTGDKVIDL